MSNDELKPPLSFEELRDMRQGERAFNSLMWPDHLTRVTVLVDSLYQDFGTTSVLNIEREVLIAKILEFVTDTR